MLLTFAPSASQMMNSTLSAACLALGLLLMTAGCRSTSRDEVQEAYPPIQSSELGTMNNVSVSGGVWFGSVPSGADLDLAHRRGISRVLDLTTPKERASASYDIGAACAGLGMNYRDLVLEDPAGLTSEVADIVLAELAYSEEPVLLFCGSGGRCAMFFAIHRVIHASVPVEEALIEARRAGMKPDAEQFVRVQVARLQS